MIPVLAYTIWQAYQAATHYAAVTGNVKFQRIVDGATICLGVAVIVFG